MHVALSESLSRLAIDPLSKKSIPQTAPYVKQSQSRENALSDHKVLENAPSEVNRDALTEGQRNTLLELVQFASFGAYNDRTFIPVRKDTPSRINALYDRETSNGRFFSLPCNIRTGKLSRKLIFLF